MAEFFRKANWQFVLADDPKFQAMFQHLRPTVRLPTSKELIVSNLIRCSQYLNIRQDMVIREPQTFKQLDKIEFPDDPDFLRSKLVTKYAYQLNEKQNQDYSNMSPTSGPSGSLGAEYYESEAEQNAQEPFLDRDVKEEPVTDYEDVLEDVKPDLKTLQAAMMPTEETKPNLGLVPFSLTAPLVIRHSGGMPLVETRPDFGPLLTVQEPRTSMSDNLRSSVKRPMCDTYNEKKPFDTSFPAKVPKLEENLKEESQSRSGSEVSSEPGDQDPNSLVPLPVTLTRRHSKPNTLITYKQVPGVVRYPCIVCLQRQEPIKVRPVNNNDAYLMIYLCFSENMYTLDKAREIARMQKFKVCVNHLSSLVRHPLSLSSSQT